MFEAPLLRRPSEKPLAKIHDSRDNRDAQNADQNELRCHLHETFLPTASHDDIITPWRHTCRRLLDRPEEMGYTEIAVLVKVFAE